ncbi:Sodium/hydrogen exchanger 7 [Durusdinium trenchii]|uniref:Sodium/hydrogen exchanger 7 n=1 Tax=Durusdinium trenchii TaxID=1381693 RepID=A0ABP0JQH3_9DINO
MKAQTWCISAPGTAMDPSKIPSQGMGVEPSSKRLRISGAGGRLVMDIGANFGQSSERYLEAGFKVVAVEPNPVAAQAIRARFADLMSNHKLVLEEKAVWDTPEVKLYINKEDSEWSSCFHSVGSRYDTEADELDVESTSLLAALFKKYGTPWYLKLDTEGADGIILQQLSKLSSKPPFLSFELNSLTYLEQAAAQGYEEFKVVPQSHHKAKHLLDEHGRPLTHAGEFGEDAVGLSGKSWISQGDATSLCRRLCLVHDEHADVQSFATGPPRYVDRDFATLRACFPVESKNDEEWYDIHCRHRTALQESGQAANS